MYEKIKNMGNNHIITSCLSSVFVVFLLWGIFFAQYFMSDTVTLARNGDEARQTFPAFIQMGELISEGTIDGVDVTTVNGSCSIHTNGLEHYVLYRIFAYFGKLSSPLLMFLLFHAFHTFINMYFTQRLCYRYFKMPPLLSFLIATANLAINAAWFISFYVIATLVIPLIYGIICMLSSNNKVFCVLSSLFYVAAFTSGYATLSCILALTVFLFSLVYAIMYNINNKRNIVCRAFSSAIIGAGVCMLYLLIQVIKNGNSSTKYMTSLSMALDFSSNPTIAFPKLFLYSNQAVLSESTFWMGPIWFFLILVFVFTKVTTKMGKGEKIIFWTGTLLYTAFFLIDLGGVLPFEKWFYMVPVFGGMHLRRRYFHIFSPLLFLSFGIALQKLEDTPKKEKLIQVGVVYTLLMVVLYVISGENINREAMAMELVLMGIAVYIGIVDGFMSKKFLLLFSIILLCYQANILYSVEEVTVSSDNIKRRSIAFDADKQAVLDNFVDSLPEKEIYKYVAMEGDGSAIPLYVPGNYGWYHRQNNLLSNYLKYPLHGSAVSDEYRAEFGAGWYNSFNINYLYDTRADFAILTEEIISKNPDNYNLSSDLESVFLNDTLFCAKLEKYIPRHYTKGDKLVVDKSSSLDNGYFYCPTLTNDDIQDFDTNDRNYFKITVNTQNDAELQYSMFAMDDYSYYIDGKKYEPEIDYGLAYFSLPSGKHCVEIIYKDTRQIVVYWIFTIYYALILVAGGVCAVQYYIKKRGKR